MDTVNDKCEQNLTDKTMIRREDEKSRIVKIASCVMNVAFFSLDGNIRMYQRHMM